MRSLFNLENPVWKFIGNLWDFFLLSLLWLVCSLPIITIGASTAALYYTTLKMASNQEGYTCKSFLNSFKQNLKEGICIWGIILLIAFVLAIDLYWALTTASTVSLSLMVPFVVVAIALIFTSRLVFILLARCDNSVKNLLFMSVSMSLKNFLPVLSTLVVSIGYYMFGIFVFWPVLLVGPGLCAYINSFIFNHILNRYGFSLAD